MKTKFVFLLLPEIHLMDLAGPDQAIHEAIDFGAEFEIEHCNLVPQITTTSGLSIGKTKHYTEVVINKGDYLIIPGSNASYLLSEDFKKEKNLLSWLKDLHQNGVNICSICAGAFALAECGLLDNISCTTHFKRTRQLQELYPKTKVIENILFTDNNGIYTSAGIASGIDLSLHIIEKLKGSHFAHLVARELVVYNRRSGNSAQDSELLQFRNHIHSGIHKAQDWILDNIHIKTNLEDLAGIANMSERNFTRIFKKETNVTVNDFITIIRKEKSRELLKNPDFSRIEIAQRIGLQSERQLSRIINSY
ncbi:GlxA family transcriptional regulator [Flavobacterium wongokense]|uniref:GlxA family transcriptional regulator n=1 Tax=Flavobacterium wongokense TaxID=2910674 RepID=UPI001F322321|nr:DJ-1/PfpI family protein [Flavobacterium sp. WG47]MCF6132544.1 DJ-1/PfpI family protein [Flavobacterium sp. WG47]